MPSTAAFKTFMYQNLNTLEHIVADTYRYCAQGATDFAMVDGGAHKGLHTKQMLNMHECRVVYAIEADPAMGARLAADMKGFTPKPGAKAQLRLIHQALQDDPAVTEITWRSSPSHVGRSSIVRADSQAATIWADAEGIDYRPDRPVPATTLDRLLAEEPGPLPFIKLDLEGADLMALRGARQTLIDMRPTIAFENSVKAPRVHGFTISDIVSYFQSIRYVPMNFCGQPLTEGTWFNGGFEALAVPQERAQDVAHHVAAITDRHMAA